MLLEAETNKYCPGGNDFGAISNLITWVLNFFLSALGTPNLPFFSKLRTQTLETCENGLVFDGHGSVYNYCNYNWAVDCGKAGVMKLEHF